MFSWFIFLIAHYLCIKMPSISEHWFCILLLHRIYFFVIAVFFGVVCRVFYVQNCHLQMMTVFLSPLNLYAFHLFFLFWLLGLGLLKLCGIRVENVNIPVLFLKLRGKLLVFACWSWCWLEVFTYALLCWVMSVYSHFAERFLS